MVKRKQLTHAMGTYLITLRGTLSMKRVVQGTGISLATWSRIERGYAPTVETLIKLHDSFACPWDELMAQYRRDFMPEEALTHGAA